MFQSLPPSDEKLNLNLNTDCNVKRSSSFVVHGVVFNECYVDMGNRNENLNPNPTCNSNRDVREAVGASCDFVSSSSAYSEFCLFKIFPF